MRHFLFKIILYFVTFGLLVFIYILLIYLRPDLVDAFYYRFTTPKAHSLILGASRAAQGIQPAVVNRTVCTDENKIINHAFAIGPSSFGPNYLKEITKKLDSRSNNGLFIIEVDPWILVKDAGDSKDDSTLFFEVQKKLFVGNLKSSTSNPNFEYLLHHWVNKFEPFMRIFKYIFDYSGITVLHADGWLEVTPEMDSIAIKQKIISSTEEYRNKKAELSGTRFYYLNKIIRYVDKYGEVVLVRMPVSEQMAQLENERYPDFDSIIQQLADENKIHYFNFLNLSGQFKTVDTHHLYKKEGERFTYLLCDSILDNFKNPLTNFNVNALSKFSKSDYSDKLGPNN